MKKTNSAAQQSIHIPSGFFNASTSEHYSSLPMKVLFAQDPFGGDTCKLNVDWGTFLSLLSVHNGVENYALPGFCVWPKISSMNHTNATSIIVIDYPTEFDILKLAPQFQDIECASYVTNDSGDDGDFPFASPYIARKVFSVGTSDTEVGRRYGQPSCV
jgi:hypothetical protein